MTTLIDPALDADRTIPDPEVDELLRGAVDLHVHPDPSPYPRRIGILDAARDAASVGFDAIVVKSHHLSMQTDVLALGPAGLDDLPTRVYGGIALNHTVGGINPYAVELVLALGGKVVWFPTISSRAHITHHANISHSAFPTSEIRLRDHPPLPIVGSNGEPTPEVMDVLALIAEHRAVLNCGHLAADDIEVLIPAARAAGVDRIVVSHPNFIVNAAPDRVAGWAQQGAYVEHCFAFIHHVAHAMDIMLEYVDAAGVEKSIFSSDAGQQINPLPVTLYRRGMRQLLDAGRPSADVAAMIGGNARSLLGSDGQSS